jgi:hypothetical protein
VDGRAADVVVGVEEGFGEQGADVAAAEAVDDTLVCALVSRSSRPNRRRRAEMGRQFFDDAVDPGVVVDRAAEAAVVATAYAAVQPPRLRLSRSCARTARTHPRTGRLAAPAAPVIRTLNPTRRTGRDQSGRAEAAAAESGTAAAGTESDLVR